ncbi:MAG TPA: MlaD family protein [Phycisphaerales bacterium]|nr:MlaD family protein [Phycisphaerales bacterium]
MTEAAPQTAPPTPPAAIVGPRGRFSWAWLLPVLALGVAAWLLYSGLAERGPLIEISFENGSGIRAGDPVSYRGVRIGEVETVSLAASLESVRVRARLDREASGVAVEGSRFWVVRPEVSLAGVTGLETLLGPRYIEVQPGDGPRRSAFAGLEQPPGRPPHATSGSSLELVLLAPTIGSISAGSPVLYRGLQVGSVRTVGLAPDARAVEITVRLDAVHANLVRDNSRFWNAGGLGVDWGITSGLTVRAGSLQSVVGGGVAFATPDKPGAPVADGHRFTLEPKPDDDWLEWAPALDVLGRPGPG